MVIEFKGHWNEDQSYDQYKIGYLVNKVADYKYKSGKTILLGKYREEVKIEDFS